MLPTIGGGDNRKLDGNGSFLSRMLGRSPSKGSLSPQPGQIQALQGPSAPSGPLKGSAGVLDRTAPPPQGSLKTAAVNASGNSGGWSIESNKQEQGLSFSIGRVPSAKNLQDAASRPTNNPLASSINSNSNNSAGGLVQRIPSAQRLSPIAATARTASPSSDASKASAPKSAAQEDEDISNLSTEELRKMALALQKETQALRKDIHAISGSGKPASGSGVPSSAAAAATHSSGSLRTSAVTFGPTTTHRSSTLVVEFAEPRHQQRPSMIAQTVEQIRAGLAPAVSSRPRESTVAPAFGSDLMEAEDEISFDEDNSNSSSMARVHAGKSYAGPPKGAASLETGPSLDPLQATRALAEAAEVKRQLMMSQSVKAAAEAEAKRAAEAKKAAEAAAAAAQAAAAAAPAKPVSKRRYKLLSVYALLPPSMRREEWSLSQFAVEKRLHKGYASEVYKARDTQSGEMMAVKVYNLQALGELNKVQLIREIRLHGSMAHRNIIELYVAFQEESRVILAQKYAEGGDLLKALHHAGGRLTEHSAVSMVIQPLLSCMVYLHGKGIIHRDIKPENILFDQGVLKVADFGLALNTNEEHAVTRAGTLHYMAPEVVKNPLKDHPDDFKNEQRYHYNVVVDSWAVGCLAYELLVGYPPFTANSQQQVVHNINNMQVQYTKRMSEDAIDFIKGALERIPHDRVTSMELIKHPWIQQHMRRGSSRHLTLQPQIAVAKTTTDFASGTATARKMDTARRAADHGPKEAIMAPF